MGRNSRARREARRRATPDERPQARRGAATDGFPFAQAGPDVDEAAAFVEAQVVVELHRIAQRPLRADLTDRAADLLRRLAPLPPSSVRRVADEVADRIVAARVESGWCPDDLEVLVLRTGVVTDRAGIARWLRADLRASDPEAPWRDQVERFDPGPELPQGEVSRIAAALHLAALLQSHPGLPRTTTRRTRRSALHRDSTLDAGLNRKLATVRGLLAKAESTTFDEEAEALCAKAQELITRYALERLLGAASDGIDADAPEARRVWLEAPYIRAKAQLVHEVATANAARAVLSDPPGACTVVGTEADLDAVELLVTSLLVQANAAMLRYGRAVDARGASRTRSFRQSFLMAFAVRIGERLTETAEQVLHDSGHEAALLPVLRSREEAVVATFDALVPHLRTRSSVASDPAGWRAGQAAADRASIDVRRRIAEGEPGAPA